MKARAIRMHQTGGPEVMALEELELGAPGPGQVLLRQSAIGLNYIDTYHRTGLYPLPLPSGLGLEGAGRVEAVGDGVEDLRVGDHVAYAGGPIGGYADLRIMPAAVLVKIPTGVSDETAAAAMLQGMTVEYLLNRTYRVKPGESILIHAAAGGVGLIAGQWAKALGARAIGVVSSQAKADLAKAHGYAEVIIAERGHAIAPQVRKLTGGQGVPVVYDSVGKDTFMDSLDCLMPRGLMVSFGNASGPVPPFELSVLGAKGSLFITRPSLMAYTSTRTDLIASAEALFAMMASGAVKIDVHQRFALADVAAAHRALESRATVGSTILLP